jgi:RNA polymerase sigma-70 factor (ECF subfamily)
LDIEVGLSLLGGLLPTVWRTEAGLLQAALAGDHKASGALTDRLMPPAHALAWRLTGNPADAEDVVQEAFCRLWQHAERFEPRAKVSTWFLTIVRNLCMDRFRRSEDHADASVLETLADAAATPEENWHAGVRSARLHEALQALPFRQRAALMMWAWQELDVPAIARELGMTDNAAHQLLFRARAGLKTRLSGEDGND